MTFTYYLGYRNSTVRCLSTYVSSLLTKRLTNAVHHSSSRSLCHQPTRSLPVRFSPTKHAELHKTVAIFGRWMAGHSKWQNIKHVKSSKDQHKAKLFDRMCRQIRVAVNKAGTNNPKISSLVASAVEEAKDNSVPTDTIERALKAGLALKENLQTVYYEVFVSNYNIIVETMTNNSNRTRSTMKKALKEYPVSIVVNSPMTKFELKGIFIAFKENGETPTADDAMEDAIDLNVEEVVEIEDEDKKMLQFTCGFKDFGGVKSGLKSKGYILKQAGLEYVATSTVKISAEEEKMFGEVCEIIENAPDVEKIYCNVE